MANTFPSSGNAGIGTTSPSSNLTIDSPNADGWNAGLRLAREDGGDARLATTASEGLLLRNFNNSGTSSFDLRNYQDTSLVRIKTDGKVGIGASSPAYRLDVAGDVRATGSLIEKAVIFTPTTVGWYRIATASGSNGGVMRIFNNGYDNTITDIEFQFNIGGYNQNGSIQLTRYSSYNGGVVGKVRISSDGGANIYLDIYIQTAGSPQPVAIYGYGPNLTSFISSPVVGAVAGSSDVRVLEMRHGFVSTSDQFLIASPTVPTAEVGYAMLGLGTNDNGGGFQYPVQLKAIAAETPSGGHAPSSMAFFTGFNNGPSERMRITRDGNVGIGTTSPSAKLQVEGDTYQNGGQRVKVTTINSNTTLDATYHTVLVNTAGGDVTVTLPAASAHSGREYRIKNKDKGNVAIVGTIDGKSSGLRLSMNDAATLVSDGSAWFIF